MTETDVRLTPEDLAALWKRPVTWVRRNAAKLGGFKVGGTWRFDPADIRSYEARGKHRDPLAPTPLSAKRQAARNGVRR